MNSTNPRRNNNSRTNNKVGHKFDKQIINTTLSGSNQQLNTVLVTCTYPCVIMGLIVNGSAVGIPGDDNSNGHFDYVVTVVEEGTTVSNMATGGSLYTPEQQVMAFGSGVYNQYVGWRCECKTKTGRKMRTGDRLYLCMKTSGKEVDVNMTVQFFCKV